MKQQRTLQLHGAFGLWEVKIILSVFEFPQLQVTSCVSYRMSGEGLEVWQLVYFPSVGPSASLQYVCHHKLQIVLLLKTETLIDITVSSKCKTLTVINEGRSINLISPPPFKYFSMTFA